VLAFADKSLWELFRAFAIELPASPGTSALARSLQDTNAGQGWRFMGQRSSLDSLILGNLLYPRVGTIEKQRLLPSGLDIMAVINSPAAQQALETKGDLAYQNISEQLKKLQEIFQMLPVESWVGQVYSSWLYAYQPQLQRNLPTSPSYMQSSNWTFKDLNSTLGSWADLKRDAAVKIDHPQATPIADSPTSDPVPAYVEPDPDVFYRLGDIASTTAEGLTQLGMKGVISADPTRLSLNHSIANLLDLGDRLVRLGDIASKELQGTPLSQSDHALIQAPLGPEESRLWLQRQRANSDHLNPLDLQPIRMIAETKGTDGNVLQVGLGLVDRLYVIVPIEGKPYIAQGGVFSYYEFPQPRSEQINEQEWQILLDTGPPSEPLLSNNLYLPDGNPVNVLSFRVNDSYQVTPQSIQLILLESPKNQSKVIMRLKPGELVKIVDGPVQADGYTWWKFLVNGNSDQGIEGWATENQESFQRVWNN